MGESRRRDQEFKEKIEAQAAEKTTIVLEMEERLYHEYKNHKKGIKVKGYWFQICTKQILEETNPESVSCLSNSWFNGFKH